MTLREKFLPKMYCFFGSGMLTNSYDEKVAESNAKECEKIADDYAVEFAEWLRQKTAQVKGNMYKLFSDFEIYTSKELLEIFKKEKGL